MGFDFLNGIQFELFGDFMTKHREGAEYGTMMKLLLSNLKNLCVASSSDEV